VFRIGHFGYFDRLDIIRGLAALEMTLERLGHPVKRGAAIAAAEGVFAEAGGPPDPVGSRESGGA
jgi:serine---pyruvate transaminase